MEFDVEKRTIYKIRHGSHAYGTNIEGSDEDFKGVAVSPIDFYLSPFKKFEQSEKYVSKGHDCDEAIYDVKKFVNLAAQCNPNIIEMLFVDDGDILFIDDFGRKLRDNANLFISKKIRHTMAGYAHSQAQRIKTHRAWLLNPPKEKPEREHYGLSKVTKLTESEIGAYEHVLSSGEELPENIMVTINKEKKYAAAKRNWDQYINWKNTRNKARAELEAKYGYDCKHGYHLVRLMRMAKEALDGKGIIVKRPDREELIHIRKGGWTYDQMMEWFEDMDAQLDVSYKNSSLPFGCDQKRIDELCVELILKYNQKEILPIMNDRSDRNRAWWKSLFSWRFLHFFDNK